MDNADGSRGVEPASLRIETHDFAIPLCEMTITAVQELFVRPAGADSLDVLLEEAVGCGDIAKRSAATGWASASPISYPSRS